MTVTAEIGAGTVLPASTKPPITREQLNAYAEASGDFNKIHLDDEEARKAGLSGVIAHGMLSMAFMGEYVIDVFKGQARIETFNCRFKAMTFPGDVISVSGVVRAHDESGRMVVAVETKNQKGETTAVGQVTVLVNA